MGEDAIRHLAASSASATNPPGNETPAASTWRMLRSAGRSTSSAPSQRSNVIALSGGSSNTVAAHLDVRPSATSGDASFGGDPGGA
jgi:hypothetical protein